MVKILEILNYTAVIASIYFFGFYESEGYLDIWLGTGCIISVFVLVFIQLEYFGEEFVQMGKDMDAESIRKSAEMKAKREAEKNDDPDRIDTPKCELTDSSGVKDSFGRWII